MSNGPRLYTLDSANALLPTVIPMLERLRDDYRHLAMLNNEIAAEVAMLERHAIVMMAHRAEGAINETAQRMKDVLGELYALGVEVKDIESGLIDFLSEREGRLVYLCWRLGEDHIAYWHDLDAGFAGRQPIEDEPGS
jgi:hypothetical protein